VWDGDGEGTEALGEAPKDSVAVTEGDSDGDVLTVAVALGVTE